MVTMVEEMEGLTRMVVVGVRKQQKQRRCRQDINEGLWEINFGGDSDYDGDGGRDMGQWRWRFWENHYGVDVSWQR